MKKSILVSEAVAGPEIAQLAQEFDVVHAPDLWKDPAALCARIAEGFDGLFVRNQTRVTPEVIAAAGPRLQVVGRAGVGLETVDVPAATAAGVVVTYAPEQNSISVAELALGLMLSLARPIPAADRDTRAGGWDRVRFTGTELYGKTLGLVGLGRIGFRVGIRAKAFGMKIAAYDVVAHPDSLTVAELGAALLSLEDLLAQSDFISVHVPDTAATRGMFNAERFAQMKKGAYFLNTARGSAVVEADLAAALGSGHLGGAALDVRATEPPAKEGDPFATLPNVILTPHMAAFTKEGQKRVLSSVCDDLRRVLSGEPARNFANFARPNRP